MLLYKKRKKNDPQISVMQLHLGWCNSIGSEAYGGKGLDGPFGSVIKWAPLGGALGKTVHWIHMNKCH